MELGDASYSTYLSYVLVLSALGHLFALMSDHNAPREAGFVIACVVAGNAVGVASYRLIERGRSTRAPINPRPRDHQGSTGGMNRAVAANLIYR